MKQSNRHRSLWILLLVPHLVSAHGFGARIDLPIPFTLYAWGAGITVFVSFVIVALFLRTRLTKASRMYDIGSDPYLRPYFLSPVAQWIYRLLILAFFSICIVGGFLGEQVPSFNIIPTAVWILFAVGMVYVASFLGNPWGVMHPAMTLSLLLEKLRIQPRVSTQWPERLGIWPACAGYVLFRWIENVYPDAATPSHLSALVLCYVLISLLGMQILGRKNWLQYCDPFYVFFEFLASFSMTERRDRSVFLRFPSSGLLKLQRMSISQIFFEMVMLAGISYDGMKATPTWQPIRLFLENSVSSTLLAGTVSLFIFIVVFASIYVFFCYLINIVSRKSHSPYVIASAFAFSLLPIAVAYELAHFLTLLVYEGQRIVYLLSDPIGRGWDLFGTATYEVNYQIISFPVLWNVQVAAIVIGHIIAVYVSHVRALSLFGDHRLALRSQYPMIILMILYTVFSLWIIGQPILE